MTEIIVIVTLCFLVVFLIWFIARLEDRHEAECNELIIKLEDERRARSTEKLCRDIFLDHYKKQKDSEIALLREALHNSERKRKELCTRLWEEELK